MEEKKEKWYPGKYMNKLKRGSTVSSSSNNPNDDGPRQSATYSASDYEPSLDHRDSFDGSSDVKTYEAPISSPAQSASNAASTSGSTQVPNTSVAAPSIGKVRVRIHEIRYLTIQNAKVAMELDGIASVFHYSPDKQEVIEREFELRDVTSDLKIEFRGMNANNQPTFGIIMIPIVTCLSFAGAPLPPSSKWREIYPYYDKSRLIDSPKTPKFRSGFPDVPGSAMTHLSPSLGFVLADIQLTPASKSGISMYFTPSPVRQSDLIMIRYPEKDPDCNELGLTVNNARIQRDIDRITSAVLRPPAIIAQFLSLPEVFVLLAVFGYMCCSFSANQIPLALFFIAFFNGLWTNATRKFTNVVVWNETGGATSISAGLAANVQGDEGEERNRSKSNSSSYVPSAALLVLSNSRNLQERLSALAHNLEVLNNLFTFADSRVSLVFYGFLFALSVISSIWITLFSAGTLVFLLGALILLALASASFLEDQVGQLPANSVYHGHVAAFRKIYGFWKVLLSKVPDDLELHHRYICGLCFVKELGGEMADAAANFAANSTSKSKDRDSVSK